MERSRPLQMPMLAVAVFAASYARTAIGPLQEAMRSALALTDNQIAILQGPALALPVVFAAVALGALIDKVARVRLLLVFATSSLLGSVLTALAPAFGWIVLARCLVGLTATATFTAAISLGSDLCEPQARGRVTMVIGISQTLGTSAAFALGGMLLVKFEGAADAWRWSLAATVGPALLGIVSIMALHEPPRAGREQKGRADPRSWPRLWSYRGVIGPLLFGIVLMEVVLGAIQIWAAPVLSRSFAVPADRIGNLLAVALIIAGVAGPVLGGTLADVCQRYGGPNRSMLVLGMLALAGSPGCLFGFAADATLASVILVVLITLLSAACIMATTLFVVVIPNELRGLSVAILFAVSTLFAIGVAPMLVSLLSSVLGGPARVGTALAALGVVACLGGSASFLLGRKTISKLLRTSG